MSGLAAAGQGVEVGGEQSHMIEIATVGFAATLKNDRPTRNDPLGYIAWLHSQEIIDCSIEEVAVGCKDLRFVLIQFLEVAFQLLQAFSFLLLTFCAVTLTIVKGPQGMKIDEHWIDYFPVPLGGIKF